MDFLDKEKKGNLILIPNYLLFTYFSEELNVIKYFLIYKYVSLFQKE